LVYEHKSNINTRIAVLVTYILNIVLNSGTVSWASKASHWHVNNTIGWAWLQYWYVNQCKMIWSTW